MSATAQNRLMRRARRSLGAGRLDDALKTWRALLLTDPESLPAHVGLGTVLRRMGRIAESEAVLRTGLERHPHAPALMAALAETLGAWEATEEAVAMAEQAAKLASTRPEVMLVLARLRFARGEDARGRAALEAALESGPRHVPTLIALGQRLRLDGEGARALTLLERAVKLAPKDPGVLVQRALALLSIGRLNEGFRAYEARWKTPEMLALGGLQGLDPGIPPWDGSPLAGKKLLVRAEQGLSETIQFCRLVREIEGGRTVLEVAPELVPLIRASRIADEVVAKSWDPKAPPPDADVWVPLLSLPDLLAIDQDAIAGDVPYLRADPSLLAPWRNRLGGGVKIGIAWRGGEPMFEGRRRSIPLAAFAPLAALPGVRLISLQKGEGRQDIDAVPFGVEDPTDEMDEGEGAFLDTAAVMDSLALIVTADTAIAHLAGALERPVWCVLPPGGDWRFGWEGRDSPWYPSMTCFRQRARGGWDSVFADIARRIEAMREGRDPDALDPLQEETSTASGSRIENTTRVEPDAADHGVPPKPGPAPPTPVDPPAPTGPGEEAFNSTDPGGAEPDQPVRAIRREQADNARAEDGSDNDTTPSTGPDGSVIV